MSTSPSPEVENGPMQPRMPIKVFEGHAEWVTSVAYFSDGKHIISGAEDKTVRIWNLESQKQEGDSMMHDFEVASGVLSPDERRLVSAGPGGRRGGMVLWDLESRTVIWKKEVGVYCVAYSPNGKLVAASHLKEIVLLDAETGQQIREPLLFDEDSMSGGFLALAFSPDGTRLAAGSDESGNIRVFDVTTGALIVAPFGAHDWTRTVTSLVFTLDGQQIITASRDGFIRVWDTATGQQVGDPMSAYDSLYAQSQIVLNADGRRIAGASRDGTVRVWDLATRRQISHGDSLLEAQPKCAFRSVAWSPDGRSIVAGGGGPIQRLSNSPIDNRIHLWDVPPLDNVSVPILAEASAALPSTVTSRSRPSSLSSILDLPATSPAPPAPFKSSELNAGGEGDNGEYSTNESFDSLLDLNADGTQPAQRRKRRRRRGETAASASSPPISAVPNASFVPNHSVQLSSSRPSDRESRPRQSPATVNLPSNPPKNQASPALDQPFPNGHGGVKAPRLTWTYLWRQVSTIPQRTRNRRNPHKNCEERQESQPDPAVNPVCDSKTPSKPSVPDIKTSSTAPNTDSPAPPEPPESSHFISRIKARFRRDKHDPESIELHPPRPQKTRLPKYSRAVKVPHAQADPRLVIAPPRRKRRPRPVANAAAQEGGQGEGQGESQEQYAQAQKTATAQSQEQVQAQGTVQNQEPGQAGDSEEDDSDEGEADEQEDDDTESFRDDGCLNAICFCEYLKWLKYRRELRRRERDD
ncbi:quinon protein alcohol dehydrogenase-like superfamily [Hygrophoropsis aurantiaca]|uniref:Quinon protein alcohol dehydrogenase-like superfamily n=1 Tax=Hygrophoropsis aurantiaca TaxID=72124 RepID=A0ACB7ZTV3_9AGAM|nr:quinon protein alcohol dehydrogenase-like superfamily [Hygrophoropsis aurantiaca]